MLKYKSLLMVLCFCMVLACTATPASATVIDVNYYWPSGAPTQQSGDLAKIEEYWRSGDQWTTGLHPYIGLFRYDVTSLVLGGSSFYYFEISNPGCVSAVATYSSILAAGPDGIRFTSDDYATTWTAAHTPNKWVWYTNDPYAGINGSPGYFYIYTNAARGIVTGALSTSSTGSPITTSGPVSGPVPEPTSMLLFGMGILGVLGLRRKV